MSTTNEQIVVEFFSAFDRLDLEGALSYLTEDCVHDDKPVGIHRGKEEIRRFFAPQMKELKSFRAELKETLSVGNMVMNERVDWIELQGGKKAALPVMGAFEIQAGKIAVWRDYYDMGRGSARANQGWTLSIGEQTNRYGTDSITVRIRLNTENRQLVPPENLWCQGGRYRLSSRPVTRP